MSYTEWKIPNIGEIPAELLEMGYSPLLTAVLASRGYTTRASAGEFLSCSAGSLHDPLTLADMPKAVERIRRAVKSGESVAVFGDYDVDGITSTCLLTDYLTSLGVPCTPYIPSRLEEGYGLNRGAIEALSAQGVTLIVTVDCGITAVEEAEFAKSLGVDMIITDHHECQDTLPDAVAVVDPKRPGCPYPSHDLAGVGVAFKLLCALEGDSGKILERYADLVAVGTVADVMPLVGENRYIIKEGLKKLQTAPREGLAALIGESGLGGKKLTATSIGYSIAPRINASGRLGQAQMAADLLLTRDAADAKRRAEELCRLNRSRQTLEQQIWEDAVRMIGGKKPDAPIVLASEGWHQGVIGIAASRLTEAYNVPAIMICLTGGSGKGSSRSFGGFNLFEALSACSEHLDGFGGHALAAGLAIKRENVGPFREAIARYYKEHPPQQASTLEIDVEVTSPDYLTMRCAEELDLIEPCGNGNPRPLLCLPRAVLDEVTPIGGGKHLKLKLSRFSQVYEAVYFSCTQPELGLRAGDCADAAFMLQVNEFRGRRSVQLLITDIRRHDFSEAKRILSGSIPENLRRAPTREDCAAVYRALRAGGGAVSGRLGRFFDEIAPEMDETEASVCLRVLEELGLLRASLDAESVSVELLPASGKCELESSPLFRRLGKY